MPAPAVTAATVPTINLDGSQIIQQHFVYRLDTLEGMFARRNSNEREDTWIAAFRTYARNVVEFLSLLSISISVGRT